MHHPILLFVGIFLLARFAMRRARWRRMGYAHGGCGRFHSRRGPLDLGAPDEEVAPRRLGRHRFSRWAQRWERGQRVDAPVAKQPVDVAGALELNPRQKSLFDDILAKAKGSLASATLAEALTEVAHEPFDRDRIEDIVGPGDLADDLLQLHHSLTPEQRAKLRQVTAA
jgi:hypothetical protein